MGQTESEWDKVIIGYRKRLAIKQDHLDYVASLVAGVSEVTQSADADRWVLDVFESAPAEARNVSLGNFPAEVEQGNEFTQKALPTRHRMTPIIPSLVATISSGGTVETVHILDRSAEMGAPGVANWYNRKLAELSHLQQEQDRPGTIRARLKNLSIPQLPAKFDEAVNAYFAWKGGATRRHEAATAMRIFLDSLKGELFALASLQREGKADTWKAMACRLRNGESGGEQERLLIAEWDRRKVLYSQLSDVAKDRDERSPYDLTSVWIAFLEHTSSVLALVTI